MNPLHHPYFVKFIVYFNENQDFFECHEVLEEYWKSIPNRTKDHPLVSYILLATSLYHWRRDNKVGALRTIVKVNNRFEKMATIYPAYTTSLQFAKLLEQIRLTKELISNDKPFRTFKIESRHPILDLKVEEMTSTLELLPSNSDAIIHKHILRNRPDHPKQ